MNPILRKMQNDSKKHIPGKGKPPLFLPPIQMEPQEAAPPEDLKLVKDIAFKAVQGKPLYMDAVCPDKLPASGNAPVIVYFHGGGMVMGDRTMCPAFRYALARLGYLVYSVDYRLIPQTDALGMIADACDAYAFIRRNAERYGGSTDRYPRINIIFIASYSQYAADSFRVNASDYLLKPIDPDDLFAALSNLRFESRSELKKRVYVQCFGSFEVFVDDKPVIFKRSRSKELFAFLIDRRGALIPQDQILGILYPEEPVSETLMSSVRNYCLDIGKTFDALGCGEIIVRGRGQIGVDVNRIDCDYLRFLKGDQLAIHGFVGEYMREYEFARETEALLIQKMVDT